jgi:uncharacterized membrane protein YgcG
MMRPAMAGAAMLPHAAVRGAGAVRDLSDSGLIVRLTRGRGWIAVLSTLLGGIVALNVLSLSLNAGSGRVSLQIDELKTENSALRAQIDERLSASRVEAEALRLGLAVPDPKEITYLSAADGDAVRLARLLGTGTLLTAPIQPSSYPTSPPPYAPSAIGQPTTTTPPTTTTSTTTPSGPGNAAPSSPDGSGGGSSGTSGSGSGAGSASGGSSTGGVGL